MQAEESYLWQSYALVECLVKLGELEHDETNHEWMKETIFVKGGLARCLKDPPNNVGSIFQG